jgi:hypothetical protein
VSENMPVPAPMGGVLLPASQIRESAKQFKEYLAAVNEFVRDTLVQGVDNDYGEIPGTKKLTLLQPGADKLCGLFGLVPKFTMEDRTEDKATGRYDVRYRCELYRGDIKVGEAIAFASSFESKWRYRFGSRVCPDCSKDTIRKSKAEWGGGFYCNAKQGGCGAKFPADDSRITEQEVGKITNVDIVDVFNTVEQVCQKRAKVAAVRNATRLTDMFTQDVGDPENTKGEDEPDKMRDVPYTPDDAPHTTDRKPTAPAGNGKTLTPWQAAFSKAAAAQFKGIPPEVVKSKIAAAGKLIFGDSFDGEWRKLNQDELAGLLAGLTPKE